MSKLSTIILFGLLTGLTGCGGGGGGGSGGGGVGPAATATGVFKDSNVSGMNYVSGQIHGVTASDGSFTYETGKTVTFSVGGVMLGSAMGKPVITPVDLVPGGTATSVPVINRVRFLIMLDQDGNPANGIRISTAVQTAAAMWAPLDFTTMPSSTLTTMMSDAASADGGVHSMPDTNTAQTHMESTLLCTHAGAFKGTFSGSDNGPFGVMLDASTGDVLGMAYSNTNHQLISISATNPMSSDQNATFMSNGTMGGMGMGPAFSGSFMSSDAMSGTWSNGGQSGVFSATRIGGMATAMYRFTGKFDGSDHGLFAFDIDAANKISGVAYSVVSDQMSTITGSLSGSTVSASASNGMTITGNLDTVSGMLSGAWTGTSGMSGTYSGHGCKLN